MRFRFEATPEELWDKKESLVKALSQQFQPIDSEIADALEKALPHKEPSLKFRVLEDIRKRTSDTYQQLMDKMVADIGKVLDGKTVLGSDLAALAKSIAIIKAQNKEEEALKKSGPYIGPKGGKWADPQHKIPWRENISQKKVRAISRDADKRGKHGQEQQDHVYEHIQGDHVRVTVPLELLDDDEINWGSNKERVAEYAKLDSIPPPPRVRYGARSAKRGRKKGFVADGNHRVRAAKLKGHTHIEIMIPKDDWERWQSKVEFKKAEQHEVKDDDPDNDPDYDAEGEPIYDPKTGLTPSETAEEKEKHPEDFEEEGEDIEKSGPYIGPRGGRWADPKHTIPWKASDDKIKSLQKLVQKLGGKLREHKTDPNKIMLKVPKEYTKELMQMKQKLGLPDKIEVGQKYVMVPIPLKSSVVQKLEDKPKLKPKQTKTGKHKDPEYTKAIPYKEPKTVKEAEDWCKLQGITANFPDVATAKVVTRAISRSHPMVAKHVQFIGTSSQLKAWAKANPDKAKVAKEQAKHKMDLMKQSPLQGGSAIAVAHPTTPKPYTESVIVVKDSYWGESAANSSPGEQGSFSVSGNLGGTVTHELGHVEGFVLRHLYQEKSGQSAWEVWKSHCIPMLQKNKKQLMEDISHYGATNPHEAWAELSVLRRRGVKPAKWIQDAISVMGIDSNWWSDMIK